MRSVSVVIPFYGEPGPTLALIDQLRGEAVTQVIVADDCSPVPFPSGVGYEVVRRSSNGGFGSAVNSGAKVATGDLLLVLNSDLHLASGFVADFVAAAEPWQPVVASPALMEPAGPSAVAKRWPRTRFHIVEWLVPLARLHGNPSMGRLLGHDVSGYQATTGLVTDWVVGAALLVPRAEFWAVGGFDESFFMNSEEIDLQRRLRDRGIVSVYLPQLSVGHTSGGSSDPERRVAWVTESWMRFARKWGRPRRLYVGLLVASAVNLVWNTGRRAAGANVAPIQRFKAEIATVRRAWKVTA